MYRILYAEKADEDLTEIYSYIAEDSPERAAAYLGKLESYILQLQEFPNIKKIKTRLQTSSPRYTHCSPP